DFRSGDGDAVEDVFHSRDTSKNLRDASGLLLKERLILAVNLDVDGLRNAAGEVADVVLQQLAELGVDRRLGRRDLGAQIVDDLVDGAALPARLQLDDVVAPVRLRDDKPE